MSSLPDLTGGPCHGGREDADAGCRVHGAAEGLWQRAAAAANPHGRPQKVRQEAVQIFIHDCKHMSRPACSVSVGICTSSEFLFFKFRRSVEQLQHMFVALQQQMMGGMTTRRTRGSVGSLDGGRVFNDAIAWISQQKVRGSHKVDGRPPPPPSTSRSSYQLRFALL